MQVAPLLRSNDRDALAERCRTLGRNPGICLLAVHDQNGGVRAVEAKTAALARRATYSRKVGANPRNVETWRDTGGKGVVIVAAIVPVCSPPHTEPLGQLTLAVEMPPTPVFDGATVVGFYLPLVAATLLIGWLGSRLTLRGIVPPLTDHARQCTQANRTSSFASDDPFAQITTAFRHLAEEADHWRGKAKELELSIERRVSSRTKDYVARLRRAVREAEIDPLTGLYNRRAADRHLDQITAEHARQSPDLSMVVIDIDHFKQFNDELGHPAGDELIAFLGELLAKSVREDDLAFRLGGDEFLIILRNTTEDQAVEISQRLAALFNQYVKTWPPLKHPPSLSVGVAVLHPWKAGTGRDLLKEADTALYKAKARGRNQVATE